MPQAILSDARCWVAHMGLNQVRDPWSPLIRTEGCHNLYETERALVLNPKP